MSAPSTARTAAARAAPPPRLSALAGTGPLFLLALGRDKLRLLGWIAAIVLLVASSYLAYDTVFPDAATTADLTASFTSNTAFTLLLGQVHDLSTPGGFTAWRSLSLSSVAVSLMAIFTVVRHTRAEEDSGRAELAASAVVGRHAALTAATLLAAAGCLATTVTVTLALTAASASDGAADFAGALALGSAIGATGLVFTGVAAVTAQLGAFSRTANTLAGALLAVTYVVRGWAAATSGMGWAEWLSPFGWGERMLPYVENRWAVLILPVAVTGVALAVAHRLLAHRDLGFGIIGARPGRATAGPLLVGVRSLSWRLSRTAFLGWVVGFVLLGALYGSVTASIGSIFEDNPGLAEIVEQSEGSTDDLTLAFLGMVLTILGLVATLNGVQRVVHGRAEELEGRADPLLATSTSRSAWLSSHGVAGLVSATLVYGAGLVTFAVVAVATAPPGTVTVGRLLTAGLLELPAVWAVVAVCVAVLGAAPRFLPVAWVAVGVTFVLTIFGPALGLPDAVLNLSTFNNVPDYLTDGLGVAPTVILTAIAVALVVIGFVGIRRRDLDQR